MAPESPSPNFTASLPSNAFRTESLPRVEEHKPPDGMLAGALVTIQHAGGWTTGWVREMGSVPAAYLVVDQFLYEPTTTGRRIIFCSSIRYIDKVADKTS